MGAKPATPTAAPGQKPEDVASAQKYGAFFPASTNNPNAIEEAAKTVGNIPSSAWGFAKGLVKALNPIETVKRVGEAVTGFQELSREAGGPGKAASAFFHELPGAAYQVVPEATRGLIASAKGAITQKPEDIAAGDIGLQQAQRAITNDPFGQIAPYVFAAQQLGKKFQHPVVDEAKLPPDLNDTTASLKAQAEAVGQSPNPVDTAITAATKPIIEPVAYAFGKVKDFVSRGTRYGAAQATGLEPKTITEITDHPQEFTKERQAAADRPSLGREVQGAINERQAAIAEAGSAYKPIRDSGNRVTVDPYFLEQKIIEKTGLGYEDGKWVSNGEATIRDAGDVKGVQNLYDTWKPSFDKGELSANEFLNFRKDLTKLSKFGRELTSSDDLEALSRELRFDLNKTYRPQLPGLEQLDTTFSTELNDLKSLGKGLVDRDGNLTDGAINKIANMTGKGKDAALARLEQLSPGITYKIKILKAVEDIQHASGFKVGTYVRGGIIGGGFAMGGPIQAIVNAVLTSPELAVPLLRQYGLIKNSAAVQAVGQALLKSASGLNQLPAAALPVGSATKELTR